MLTSSHIRSVEKTLSVLSSIGEEKGKEERGKNSIHDMAIDLYRTVSWTCCKTYANLESQALIYVVVSV